MKTSLFTLFVVLPLLLATPVRATLDFTLQHESLDADGASVRGAYITDGQSKIFLRISAAWKVFNNAQALECLPETPNSKIRLEKFPSPKPLTVDQAGAQSLQQLATAQVPADAKGVVALPAELNALPLYGWNTLEVSFRYEYFGQTVRRSVMYVGMLPGRLVQLTVTAPDADFDKVHKQARQMLGSWFEPSRDLPPDLQSKYKTPEEVTN